MAIWNKEAITNAGRELIAECQAEGLLLNITNCVLSSTDYSSSDLRVLTELSNVQQTEPISEKRIKESTDGTLTTTVLTGNFNNTGVITSYPLYSFGVYGNNGGEDILIMVATTDTPDTVPAIAEGVWQCLINANLVISNEVEITISVDLAANATKQYVHDYINGEKVITIETTGWTEETDASSKVYYTKTFNVDGILATDTPKAMIKSSGAVDITTRKAIQKDYNNFFDYECGNGTYKILSYKIPTNQFIIALTGTGG